MRVYSASEAIWPAVMRTYSYLFHPFQWKSFLKLAAVATLCEGFLVSFKFYVRGTLPFDFDWGQLKSFLLAPDFLPVTVLGVIALLLAGIYCLFLITHLRFAFFHTLVHRTREFRPAARLYLIESERFFTASALVALAFLVLGVLWLPVLRSSPRLRRRASSIRVTFLSSLCRVLWWYSSCRWRPSQRR